jgi:hypothetical protein
MIDSVILVVFFFAGYAIGAWVNRKPLVQIVRKIVVDRDVLSIVSQEMAMDWADRRGLTWQPKGAVFDPNKVVKK